MKQQQPPKTKILLDSDVIINFFRGGQIFILSKIFPDYQTLVLDIVIEELRTRKFQTLIDNLFNYKILQEIAFPTENIEMLQEYFTLKQDFGKGESACMAYCRFTHDVLGSSNFKDIATYCDRHEIVYLGTLDFVLEAKNKDLMTEEDCDEFIYNITQAGGRLPAQSIQAYILSGKARSPYFNSEK